MTLVIENCAIATVDGEGTEHADGHVLVEDGRIAAVGPGAASADGRRIDGAGCLATPGLINCHHHLYQWATRGLFQQATLFEWLQGSYPIWAKLDGEVERAAARAGLAALLLSGCSTSMDHHYVFPRDGGDLLGIEIEAARDLHIRFHPTRGSMDLGKSAGGLPPDEITEDRDATLQASADAIDHHHDPSPDSMLRIALAPCSPFSVTKELMAETAEYARKRGVRLHTHMAETIDEEEFCLELFGVRPVEYLEDLGWLGDDVWLAHCVHLDEREVSRFGDTATGVAHCPSSNARLGAGIAPVAALTAAGAPVGLGVDGPASNEAGELAGELRQALLVARLAGGPQALTAREALALGTIHGARCLGREAEIGSLEPGKLADVALWDLGGIDHAGIADPVAALVLGPRPRVRHLLVGGETVVEDGRLATADEETIARELAAASARLQA
jgi:cytosine/adenosine deaminase-related metal-dependent hydrolase